MIKILFCGVIHVESTLGQGSVFTLKLPFVLVEDDKDHTHTLHHRDVSKLVLIELSDII